MNGGSVLAMAGDKCVALAVDKRFGMGLQVRFVDRIKCAMLQVLKTRTQKRCVCAHGSHTFSPP